MPVTPQPEYWFARRFPLGSGRRAFAPIHWKGRVLTIAFVVMLAGGAVAFAWLGAKGQIVPGVAVFAMVAFVGSVAFTSMANARCDQIRTAADYKKDRQRV